MAASVPVSLGAERSRRTNVPGFAIHELRFPAGLILPPHDHGATTVAVILAGAFQGHWSGRDALCPPGTLIVEPAGERHGNAFDPQSGARVVAVQPDEAQPRFDLPVSHRSQARPEALPIAWRIGQELASPDSATPMALEGLALELAAVVLRDLAPVASRPQWLWRAREMLEERYPQPIGLSDVAFELGVHPGHLARAFRQWQGMSVGAYLRQVRVRRAAERLARGSESIADIAAAVGFADQSHLARWFVPHIGVTPARYRRIVRQR
jgi:AraC family transcriptional regulator